VKNRKREICTSGSERGRGGNIPTYSAQDPQVTSTIKGSIPPELPQPCAEKIGCMLDFAVQKIGVEGVGAITSKYSRHAGRVFARGDGAGNFEFQGVVGQHKEAGAEPGGPFAGISDMDPGAGQALNPPKPR